MDEKKDIIKMMRNGEPISMADPDYATAAALIADTWKNTEYIFCAINGNGRTLADFLCGSGRQLATGIELSAANQVRQVALALVVQTMKKEILTVEPESLGGYAGSDDFEVGELRNNAATWEVSEFVYTILGEITK